MLVAALRRNGKGKGCTVDQPNSSTADQLKGHEKGFWEASLRAMATESDTWDGAIARILAGAPGAPRQDPRQEPWQEPFSDAQWRTLDSAVFGGGLRLTDAQWRAADEEVFGSAPPAAREDVVKEEQDVVKEEPASEGGCICTQPDPPSMNEPLRQLFVEATKEWLKANFTPHELHFMVVEP